ncbi:MAG: hypothetical protein KGO85_02015 [Proteobacteria bacterium]|nr:hypothetical protein [Pseudomonadota bacterium]
MGLFESMKQGDALMQMFAGNDNPAAEQFLSDAEVNAMRGRLAFRESLKAFVRGRVVAKGAGLWVLTSEAILIFGEAAYPYRMPISAIESMVAEAGQYGLTLRLRFKGASYAVFGVSMRMGVAFARMLSRASGVHPQGLEQRLSADDIDSVLHRFKDAAFRVDPVGTLIEQHPELWKQWLAQSAEQGMLLVDEYPSA